MVVFLLLIRLSADFFADSISISRSSLSEQCPHRTLSLQKPDSNRHITPYEGAASLSSHSAIVAGTGFEPVYTAYEAVVEPFQLNPQSPYRESNPDHLLGRQMCWPLHHTDRSIIGAAGIEPALTAYKTGALPLDEAPEAGTAGLEPAALCLTGRCSAN